MVSSQPSFMPRFSAAMDGWRIQVCSRLTDFVVALFDFGGDGVQIAGGGAQGVRPAYDSGSSDRGHRRGAQEGPTVDRIRIGFGWLVTNGVFVLSRHASS